MATAGKVITCRAAVCWAKGESLSIEEITVDPPKENEVRLRVVSSSFCHSDLHAIQGIKVPGLVDVQFPMVAGHEGAAVVESVGLGVTSVAAGDSVIPLFGAQCGVCVLCKMDGTNFCLHSRGTRGLGVMMDGTSRMSCKGTPLKTFLGCSTFSEYFVIDEPCVAKISKKADLKKVGVAGCCIPTGVGATRVVGKVKRGSVCAVWGLGAVGLATIMGCKLAGASTIIGIDVSASKEALGKKLGCTEFINPTKLDRPIQEYLQERFGGGCDFTFESIGNVMTMKAAYESVRPGGGVCTVLGVSSDPDKFVEVHPHDILAGKEIKGCYFGGLRFRFDVSPLVDEIIAGKICCDNFITDTLSIDKINWAIEQMKAAQGIRYVLLF
ncbi:alcohol dehydrogenase class-3-like [Thrips palmi]|uniref:Alcohol dehydrogenase class-3-like n=1 Tax=Thrips palmi TaxID=161013 RepID=A0A6P8XZF7_THRPL|nr:alcohol dehydrogenase class-3-like [Thrips palmi]